MNDARNAVDSLISAVEDVAGPEANALLRALMDCRPHVAPGDLPPGLEREASTLRLLVALREAISNLEGREVRRLRSEFGMSWPMVATVTHSASRQAAHARYSTPATPADAKPLTAPERVWITVQEAAVRVDSDRDKTRSIQRWCKAGKVKSRMVNGNYLVHYPSLCRYIESEKAKRTKRA